MTVKSAELTLEQAVEVLNRVRYGRRDNWRIVGYRAHSDQMRLLGTSVELVGGVAIRVAVSFLQEEEIARLQKQLEDFAEEIEDRDRHLESLRAELEQQRKKIELFDELLVAAREYHEKKVQHEPTFHTYKRPGCIGDSP